MLPERVQVETPYGVHFVTPLRAKLMALGANVQAIRAKAGPRKGKICRLIVRSNGGRDEQTPSSTGNPQKDVYHAESETNPPAVWAFKRQHSPVAAVTIETL